MIKGFLIVSLIVVVGMLLCGLVLVDNYLVKLFKLIILFLLGGIMDIVG